MITLRQLFLATALIALSLCIRINGYIVVLDWWFDIRNNAESLGQFRDWVQLSVLCSIGYCATVYFLTVLIDALIEASTELTKDD